MRIITGIFLSLMAILFLFMVVTAIYSIIYGVLYYPKFRKKRYLYLQERGKIISPESLLSQEIHIELLVEKKGGFLKKEVWAFTKDDPEMEIEEAFFGPIYKFAFLVYPLHDKKMIEKICKACDCSHSVIFTTFHLDR